MADAEVLSLSLLVRSPVRRHPDLRLRAAPAWSVRRLKAELRHRVPGAPAEEEQKLIYCGKLLLDHQSLGEVLPPQEELHALHLVYNPKAPTDVPGTAAEVKAAQPEMSGARQGPAAPSSDGDRLRCSPGGQPAVEASARPETPQHPFQTVAPGLSAYTTYSMLQMSWLQQIYARQYYMRYMASTAAPADPSHTRRSQEIPVTPPAPLPDPFPAQNQPGNQNAAPQVNVAANQNLRMNAQGGPLMEEEGGNRDWLDWLYSATLFYVFVNIIYFYSSVSRFLLVMGGTVLMYLHHVGWFPFRQRPAQPFPAHAPPQAAINQDQNNNLQQGGNAGRADEPEASPDTGQVLPDLPEASPSLMSTAWLFFKTFFASLLPEGPRVTRN